MKSGYSRVETEQSEQPSNSWIAPYTAQYRWRFIGAIALGTCAALCAVMLLFTSGYLISKSALRPENILMVYVPIVGVRAFGIFRAVFRYAERLAGHDAVLRVLADQRVKLYRILEPQALFLRSRMQTGDVLGALADDVERLQDIYLRTVFPAVTALVIYGAAVLAFGSVDPIFAVCMALYMLFIAAVLPAISLRLTWRWRVQLKKTASCTHVSPTVCLGSETGLPVAEQRRLYSGRKRMRSKPNRFAADCGAGIGGVISLHSLSSG